jgi:hypothetical protein
VSRLKEEITDYTDYRIAQIHFWLGPLPGMGAAKGGPGNPAGPEAFLLICVIQESV